MVRRRPLRSLAPLLPVAVALALALAACSAGEKQVAEAEVEEQAATQLAAQVNQPKPDVDCPGPLKAEVATKLECVLTAQGETQKYPVTVTVTSVEDEKVNFDVQVGESPLP